MKLSTCFLILILHFSCIYGQPNLIPYDSNPVIPIGQTNDWDDSALWWPNITVVNDTFYIIYNGSPNFPSAPSSIGLAVSADGYNFKKSSSNPILSGDGSGIDAYSVDVGCLYFKNSTWYLYYGCRATAPCQPGNMISRASSNSPHGPWIRSEDTLLVVGSAGEWDDVFISPCTILTTDTGLVMYYWGGEGWPNTKPQIGLATSTDEGYSWNKYNNPATTAKPYAESDPVLSPADFESYDDAGIWGCSVLQVDQKWEMYYGGDAGNYGTICYAVSEDGVNWVKDDDNPFFDPSQDILASSHINGPSVVAAPDTYFVYYCYSVNDIGISLATSPITSVEGEEVHIPDIIQLQQNYPNPFNPITKINYQLTELDQIELSIYNILGEKVSLLVNEQQNAGSHTVQWDATGFASGVYFYNLKTGNGFSETKKMILMR